MACVGWLSLAQRDWSISPSSTRQRWRRSHGRPLPCLVPPATSRTKPIARKSSMAAAGAISDIEKIADIAPAAAIEDFLAIGFVRLVAGGTKHGRGRPCDRLQRCLVDEGEIDQSLCARLNQPTHAMAHAVDCLHLAGRGKPHFEPFDDADKRLIDDSGRAAGLADHRIAGWKIWHASPLMFA